MSESVDVQKVDIDPIDCYKQAFELFDGQYWLMLGVAAVGSLIGGLVPIVLIGPMMCGIYMCFLERYRGNDFPFELLFKGFDHFEPGLIASLILTAVTLALLLPVFIIMFAGMVVLIPSAAADGGQSATPAFLSLGLLMTVFLVFLGLIMTVGVFFMFTFPLIVDRKLNGLDAVVVSAKAAARNFGGVFGLALIGAVLGFAGVLACYVGAFFVAPLTFAATTIAYRKVFPELAPAPASSPAR